MLSTACWFYSEGHDHTLPQSIEDLNGTMSMSFALGYAGEFSPGWITDLVQEDFLYVPPESRKPVSDGSTYLMCITRPNDQGKYWAINDQVDKVQIDEATLTEIRTNVPSQ